MGFESLLKDVKITKDKSNLNEEEINKVNEKVDLIMNELYKNKRVLLNDSKNEENINSSGTNKQIMQLRREVEFLKQEILKIKKQPRNQMNQKF